MDMLRSGATSSTFIALTRFGPEPWVHTIDLQLTVSPRFPRRIATSSKATWLRGNLWQCPITRMWRFWFIEGTCSQSMATRHHPEPGMSRGEDGRPDPGRGARVGQEDFWGSSGPARLSGKLGAHGRRPEWQQRKEAAISSNPTAGSASTIKMLFGPGHGPHTGGWISASSVVSYTNSDAENIFWVSGMAAFQLEWP